jgi:hypothetical protein
MSVNLGPGSKYTIWLHPRVPAGGASRLGAVLVVGGGAVRAKCRGCHETFTRSQRNLVRAAREAALTATGGHTDFLL